jgi:hypothetical protein
MAEAIAVVHALSSRTIHIPASAAFAIVPAKCRDPLARFRRSDAGVATAGRIVAYGWLVAMS